ncbi:beta-ketoacyl synthase N-terminal-like domain-containing protein [Streptomyces sp. DH37]|uniref:beta-ketoacyl synthase N-terminal-like domain-containing protein n=1 Tax=Streptomyces sp. DH37 TaxID=3040122 RepID=UPI0024436B7B|nr:beta-ketoacyl synthase N-terminal-like domain-containing protein [Streptomyces sp. DH37]MDG9705846.1 beta-ketoacyl synthase N-terminal-like domain-containing protein [Streptomyces sp. DH37]
MMITVTGVGVALPGADHAAALAAARRPEGTVEPAAVLGKKGLRYKDRATQLGLCAAQRVLADAGLLREGTPVLDGARTAVLVSSNLGNVDTVCRVTRTIAEEGTYGVSPMDTPNASSNIIASEIAIRFGLKGPNLTLCNGPTSGLDAVRWATTLLRAGRADHAVVVGVEPDNEIVRRLVGGPVADGGAALVLERAEAAEARGATVRAVVGAHTRGPDVRGTIAELAEVEPETPAAWFAPAGAAPALPAGQPGHDLAATWGELSGALGVVQCAAAVGALDAGADGPMWLVAGTDGDDGVATLVLRRPAPAAAPVPR